ncbi:MAG: hypothetical protein RBT75_06485 [Anaerolineae bacterium]|nr:hypothetical protein [Anaerolineae bacterium]
MLSRRRPGLKPPGYEATPGEPGFSTLFGNRGYNGLERQAPAWRCRLQRDLEIAATGEAPRRFRSG